MARIPVACLLDDGDRGRREAAWTNLVHAACSELLPAEGGIRGRFASGARDELERLVAAERACCAWAEWTVTESGDDVVLTVVAPEEPGTEVLRRLFRL